MRTWKRDQPGQYVTSGYTAIKLDRDGKWHVFDTNTKTEVTLNGLDTLRAAKNLVDGAQPQAKPAKLSPKMNASLRDAFGSEVGISYSDRCDVARSGIIEAYMVPTSTGAALVGRGYLTPIKGTRTDFGSWFERQQITAAGCEAIGRSMDEIVAWAWGQAMDEYEVQSWFVSSATIMTTLPVEVGVVVGWTHQGEPMTGEVLSIGGGYATIKGDDASPWSVPLDEIERVIELAPTCDHGVPVASAYARIPALDDPPRFPEGTPEHEAYSTELHAELEKFAKGEEPYPFGGPEGCRRGPIDKAALLRTKPIDSLLNSGARDDIPLQVQVNLLKAAPIMPPVAPKGLMALVNEAIAAAIQSERVNTLGSAHFGSVGERSDARAAATAALEAIQQRLNLAAALIPAEARAILDGHR